MKTFFLCLITLFVITITGKFYPQQSELVVKNIFLESSNSLTFDVFINNTGATNWTYSNGSFAWTFDTAFLNGGNATFSLVPGYSDFSAGAHPPSALITNPNILRTSSNMPGANGNVLAGQSLRLFRFRFQTSASSFASENFSISWKNSIVPYTRLFSWDGGTGLPLEVTNLEFSIQTLFWEENFDYPVGGLVAGSGSNWINFSGTGNLIQVSSGSLTYSGYQSSGLFNKIDIISTGSSAEDVYRAFTTQTEGTIYAGYLVNLANTTGLAVNTSLNGDHFISYLPSTSTTTFNARFSIRLGTAANTFQVGLRSTGLAADTTGWYSTDLNIGTTYLFVISYQINTGTANDIVSLWVNPPVDGSQPAADITKTASSDLGDVTRLAIRQGTTTTPNASIDGIRVATTWSEIFPVTGSPIITANPSTLSGFSYLEGAGPSASQSYNLSGSSLTPASGNIAVTGSTNYEVSLNNSTFSGSVNVAYSGGALVATPIYVRLKAGLLGGTYNGELITNTGGGATTQNVTCNGSVLKTEPTNHVTNFAGVLGTPSYYYIILNWTDAAGGTTPDGYLIKGSSFNYDSIKVPVDGVPEINSLFVQNVAQGVQTKSFGLNSATTYYFKIFPYTNTGTSINYKIDGTVPQYTIATNSAPSLPIIENFEYATGSFLTDNGWVDHFPGINPIMVNAAPLSYSGYINSGLGKSVTMTTSGEDDNRAFNQVTSGSIYGSFMVNISSAQTAGDYLFHFGPENTTTLYYAKVFVKKNAGDSLAFGVSKNVTGSVIYTPFNYALNTTYLIAVKYTFNTGTTSDDEVKLWINPVLDGIEPAANVTQTDAGTDALSLGMFALRQGGTSSAAALVLGGIRVANTWIPDAGATTFALSVDVTQGWNMVSAPGLHPTNQNVETWWPHRTGTVWEFSGVQYVARLVTTPGEGYWMKNTLTETYNYPAIQIVPHNPVPVTLGWNLMSGYETSPTITALKAANPQITGTVWGFNGVQYVAATNLVPGYGYWAKVTAAGNITIPDALAKGNGEVVELFKEDWGRITITDAAGISSTLYAVKGEVDLDQYEMPPLPPAGMFDVRYTRGRIAEDLNSIQTIDMTSVEYPITVTVENMTVRLQDETGKLINQNINSGEKITISNNQISKLRVSGELIPTVYALEQNYPNPFNPTTTIEFSLPEDVNSVKLTIYNALGERVAELVNGSLTAGKYNYQWNAGHVATGMYIYELRADKFVAVKKMVLVK